MSDEEMEHLRIRFVADVLRLHGDDSYGQYVLNLLYTSPHLLDAEIERKYGGR